MIDIITNMQNLEIRDEIYERFLAFKVKYNPNLSNEEFIQFLMTRYENCCLKVLCNGYTHGVTEHNKLDSEVSSSTPNNHGVVIGETFSPANYNDVISPETSKLITCPECKYSSGDQAEIVKHFNDCHNMSGAFSCTCGQYFCNLSLFLAHYITCPIAATDLQNTGCIDVEFDDDDMSGNDEEKEVFESHSPLLEPTEPTDDSNDEPIDFHIHSPVYSNPLNLVKFEKTTPLFGKESPIIDYSSVQIDNLNTSSPEKARLPDNNTSSIATSSPGNQDHSRKSGKVYECEHCEKIFKSKGLLDQHKHLHYPPRHECEYCGRRFRWPPQFYTHKQQCSKRKSNIIDSSDGNNFKKNGYNFNQIPGSGNNNNNINHADALLQQSGKMFSHSPMTEQCLCGYKNCNSAEMFEHKRSCVTSARALILQKIIDYKSIQAPPGMPNLNGASLPTPSLHSIMNNFLPSVVDHNNISKPHGNSNHSTVAGGLSSPSTKSNELKPFECDFCDSRFMTKISLKQHLDGKHSDQAKYCCEKCGKGYFWNASYNYHKKKCTFQPLLNMTTTGLKQ